MSKTLVRYAVIACVATAAMTTGSFVRAADQKTATTSSKSDVLSGKIEAVDVKANTVTIKHKKETKTFTVASDCKFSGPGGKMATLENLVIGDQVKIKYTEEGDKLTAHRIGHVDKEKKSDAPQSK